MDANKRKRALQLFQQPLNSEDLTPKKNKYFHTTMAYDGLDNLDIDIDYQNYDVIASGGDIIITPDGQDDIIIHPSALAAKYIAYSPQGASSTVTVQYALDDLYDKVEEISSNADYNNLKNKPTINGVTVEDSKSGEDYKLVNGENYIRTGEIDPITPETSGSISNMDLIHIIT